MFYFFWQTLTVLHGQLHNCCSMILVVSFIIVFKDIYCMPRKGGLDTPRFLHLLIVVHSVSAI